MSNVRIRTKTRRGRAAARERAEARQFERRQQQRRLARRRRRDVRALSNQEVERRDALRARKWAWLREIERGRRAEELLERVSRSAPQLLRDEHLPTLHLLLKAEERWEWVRPLETWKPRGRSALRRRSSLIEHLLIVYPVPPVFLPALEQVDVAWTDAAVALARGKSLIRHRERIVGLPPLTRAEVGHLVSGPAELSPWQAYRRAQVLAAGGSEAWAHRFARSSLAAATGHEPRWPGAIAWFVAVSDRFPAYLVERWIAFVRHQFAERPHWSLAGRKPGEVVAQIRRFEAEVRRAQAEAHFGVVYPESASSGGRVETVDETGHAVRWWFRQIRTGRALFREGERMEHCIFSYHGPVSRGEASIWSLSRDGKPVLTIEVTDGEVNEVRGRFNRTAEADERAVIGQWASHNQLRVSSDAHVD